MRRIGRHLTYSNVMVTILAFIVLTGGTAVALSGTDTVFSDDIVDNQVKAADVRNDSLAGGGLGPADLRAGSVGTSEVADNALTGADILNGSLGSAELGPIPAVRATNSANQTIPDSTPTVISLDSEGFDAANMHDPATNNSRLTAPITGAYQINGRVHWEDGTEGMRQLRIEKNRGLPQGKTIAKEIDAASASDDLIQDVSTISFLAAGDYVELGVTQQNPTATGVDALADPHVAPELSMAWLGSF
jgi:hypothetical protein